MAFANYYLPTRRDLRRVKQLRHFERSIRRELDRLGADDAQYVALAEMVAALFERAAVSIAER